MKCLRLSEVRTFISPALNAFCVAKLRAKLNPSSVMS